MKKILKAWFMETKDGRGLWEVAALQANKALALAPFVTVDPYSENGVRGQHITFSVRLGTIGGAYGGISSYPMITFPRPVGPTLSLVVPDRLTMWMFAPWGIAQPCSAFRRTGQSTHLQPSW